MNSRLATIRALLVFTFLLPETALMDKSHPQFESCCLLVTQQEVKPGHFNRFQKVYRQVKECRTSQAAVMFSLKKGGIMCVDPQKSWVKELMRRIDKVAPKSSVDKANDPSGHLGSRYQTKGPITVRQRMGTTTANQKDPDAIAWRPTWGSEVTRPEAPPPSAGSPPGMAPVKVGSGARVVEETVESSGRVGPERARRKELGRSEVALLALLPIVLVLVSVIAYLLCKRRPRNDPRYKLTMGDNVEGLHDAL